MAIDLNEAYQQLKDAEEIHHRYRMAADVARKEETIGVNNLNEAQKRFDEAVIEVRRGAPRNTDWGRT